MSLGSWILTTFLGLHIGQLFGISLSVRSVVVCHGRLDESYSWTSEHASFFPSENTATVPSVLFLAEFVLAPLFSVFVIKLTLFLHYTYIINI